MYKTITVLSLRDGTDADEFFKYHIGPHAEDALKVSGGKMKKYVINRVVQNLGGENRHFEFVEMWWESKEAHDEYVKNGRTYITASGKTPSEDFEARGAVFNFKVLVEETEIPTV
jgi:hypothetical protein